MQTNQALENEMSVIGAMFLESEAVESVTPILNANDFSDKRHRLIYGAITMLANDGAPVDLVTVTMALKENNDIDQAGGISYLSALVDFVPTAANVGYYVKQVRKVSNRRKLEEQLCEARRMLGHGEPDQAVRDFLDAALLNSATGRKGEPQHITKDLQKVMERLDLAQRNPGKIQGLEVGYRQLDLLTGGLRGGDLTILAARPAMGKTALALNIGDYCAMNGMNVAFFSLEMSRDQLAERLVLGNAEVDSGRARIGKLEENDFNRILEATERLHKASLLIDDTPSLKISELRTRCRRLKRRSGLDLIVIDYLQLMSGTGDNRTQEIGGISRALKALTKELNVPIIALSQLNRAVEQRTIKRPNLSDLRDSGEIEQDADMVWLLYRDVVYNDKADPREAELNIAKHRRGPTATIKLNFNAIFTQFKDQCA